MKVTFFLNLQKLIPEIKGQIRPKNLFKTGFILNQKFS